MPLELRGVTCHTRYHTMLLATRHKQTHHHLNPHSQ